MSSRYKLFSDLSQGQKRRRLAVIRKKLIMQGADEIGNVEACNFPGDPITMNESADNVDNSGLEYNEQIQELQNDERDDDMNDDDDLYDYEGNINVENVDAPDIEEARKAAVKKAFLAANLNHTQGNILLQMLRSYPFAHQYLPKDTRTVLNTPTLVVRNIIERRAGGAYIHIGFKKTIQQKLQNIVKDLPERLIIDLSSDGGQVHRRGGKQFWPLQYRILNVGDRRPVIAGVFLGETKPNNIFEFCEPLLEELTEALRDLNNGGGVQINKRLMPLEIRLFIADAPARAFFLNHFGHNSLHACSKCWVVGSHFAGTTVFIGTQHRLRTDAEYRDMVDEDHHKGPSPLSHIMGLVSQVPSESMHLIYLGVTSKLLTALVSGGFTCRRFTARQLSIVDSRMEMLKMFCPSDFNRNPSILSKFSRMKATQLRQFLLYIGPVVLKSVIPNEYYNHFVLLHYVIRLLNLPTLSEYELAFSQVALEGFVRVAGGLYGNRFLSYNTHNLLHIVDDVRRYGTLDSMSAFCYENSMPEFRDKQRKPAQNLEQYYKRVCERNEFLMLPPNDTIIVKLTKKHNDGPLPVEMLPQDCDQYEKIQIGKVILEANGRNSCLKLKNQHICIIKNIYKCQENVQLYANRFRRIDPFYNSGASSETVGVHLVTSVSDDFEVIELRDIQNKCYLMPKWSAVEGEEENVLRNEFICIELLTPFALPPHLA